MASARDEAFERNFNWQQRLTKEVMALVKYNARHLIDVSIASEVADKTQATDYVMETQGKTIAVRLRRYPCSFQDFTIRATARNKYNSELEKLKRGFADYYVYGWMNTKNWIAKWILVDMAKVRQNGILEKDRTVKMNYDGVTGFVIIGLNELEGCIVDSYLEDKHYK